MISAPVEFRSCRSSSQSLELCRLIKKIFRNCNCITLNKNVSLLLPSHNLHHVVSMFSFQGTSELIRSKKASVLTENFVQRIYLKKEVFNRPRSGHLNFSFFTFHFSFRKVVGQSGLEPPTSRLSVVCSSQLSYWPVSLAFRSFKWWRLAGSNR